MTKIKVSKDYLWFTSDLHFFHTNILKYCNRPWKTIQAMNQGLVDNWNQVVNVKDDIFILGDLALGGKGKASMLADILKSLNGNKYLVPGNHDTYVLKSEECLSEIEVLPPLFELRVSDSDAKKGRQNIVLCHYALKVWNGSHRGSWNLHGHSHGSMPPDFNSKSIDVGIDVKGYDYRPVSYERVKDLMSMYGSKPVDHHNSRTK